jgi:3-hydroxyisobutyrate dehydrogenase-like beta-hydroxyacid dehydrogenase
LAQRLGVGGLEWCESARAVSQAADVVFTSLPDDHVIEEVAAGTDGLLAGLGPEKIWVDMSTVSPRVGRELATQATERGATMLDAPVSGSVPQVQAGTLTIMVGGDEDAYSSVELVRRVGGPRFRSRREERA